MLFRFYSVNQDINILIIIFEGVLKKTKPMCN